MVALVVARVMAAIGAPAVAAVGLPALPLPGLAPVMGGVAVAVAPRHAAVHGVAQRELRELLQHLGSFSNSGAGGLGTALSARSTRRRSPGRSPSRDPAAPPCAPDARAAAACS